MVTLSRRPTQRARTLAVLTSRSFRSTGLATSLASHRRANCVTQVQGDPIAGLRSRLAD